MYHQVLDSVYHMELHINIEETENRIKHNRASVLSHAGVIQIQ